MNTKTFYIGLATTFHDPALAVVSPDGEVLFAEATERFLQDKHAYTSAADVRGLIRRVLREYCDPNAAYVVAKPWSAGFCRLMDLNYLSGITNHEKLAQRAPGMTRFLVDKSILFQALWQQQTSLKLSGGNIAGVLLQDFGNRKIRYLKFQHHLAHAANACFTSPFDEAACVVVDGQGEGGSMTYLDYRHGRLKTLEQLKGPESLGILYSICTDLCGFSSEAGEEWKMMGLAAYGELDPDILDTLQSLINIEGLKFKYPSLAAIKRWTEKMKTWARAPDAPPISVANLAHTVQFFYEQTLTELLGNFHQLGVSDHLVLGGGCALNSSYNGKILDQTGFSQLHVPSAPGDDGNALGCALLAYYQDHPHQRPTASIQSPYLGSSIPATAIANLMRFGRFDKARQLTDGLCEEVARLLAEGKLIGWVQGRAEFGPRALGNRSILADPRDPDMKDRINALVKFREGFRPFAPAIIDAYGADYFENYQCSPYMERTLRFRPGMSERVPAVVHIDGTGRVQSVRREWNARYHDLLAAFHARTGVPILLNTSFNIMGKPIINSLEDALGLFFTTGLDALVIGDYLIEK